VSLSLVSTGSRVVTILFNMNLDYSISAADLPSLPNSLTVVFHTEYASDDSLHIIRDELYERSMAQLASALPNFPPFPAPSPEVDRPSYGHDPSEPTLAQPSEPPALAWAAWLRWLRKMLSYLTPYALGIASGLVVALCWRAEGGRPKAGPYQGLDYPHQVCALPCLAWACRDQASKALLAVASISQPDPPGLPPLSDGQGFVDGCACKRFGGPMSQIIRSRGGEITSAASPPLRSRAKPRTPSPPPRVDRRSQFALEPARPLVPAVVAQRKSSPRMSRPSSPSVFPCGTSVFPCGTSTSVDVADALEVGPRPPLSRSPPLLAEPPRQGAGECWEAQVVQQPAHGVQERPELKRKASEGCLPGCLESHPLKLSRPVATPSSESSESIDVDSAQPETMLL
jgi:hypothetical protein